MGIADAEGFDDAVTQELISCVLAYGQHIHHLLDRQYVLGKPALFYFDDLDQFFFRHLYFLPVYNKIYTLPSGVFFNIMLEKQGRKETAEAFGKRVRNRAEMLTNN